LGKKGKIVDIGGMMLPRVQYRGMQDC